MEEKPNVRKLFAKYKRRKLLIRVKQNREIEEFAKILEHEHVSLLNSDQILLSDLLKDAALFPDGKLPFYFYFEFERDGRVSVAPEDAYFGFSYRVIPCAKFTAAYTLAKLKDNQLLHKETI